MQSNANVTDERNVILGSFSRFHYPASGISRIRGAPFIIVCCEFLRLCVCVLGVPNLRANAVHGWSGGDESSRCQDRIPTVVIYWHLSWFYCAVIFSPCVRILVHLASCFGRLPGAVYSCSPLPNAACTSDRTVSRTSSPNPWFGSVRKLLLLLGLAIEASLDHLASDVQHASGTLRFGHVPHSVCCVNVFIQSHGVILAFFEGFPLFRCLASSAPHGAAAQEVLCGLSACSRSRRPTDVPSYQIVLSVRRARVPQLWQKWAWSG